MEPIYILEIWHHYKIFENKRFCFEISLIFPTENEIMREGEILEESFLISRYPSVTQEIGIIDTRIS